MKRWFNHWARFCCRFAADGGAAISPIQLLIADQSTGIWRQPTANGFVLAFRMNRAGCSARGAKMKGGMCDADYRRPNSPLGNRPAEQPRASTSDGLYP